MISSPARSLHHRPPGQAWRLLLNAFFLLLISFAIGLIPASAREPERARNTGIPPTEAKVLVGYQGWFRCPGDGSPRMPGATGRTVLLLPRPYLSTSIPMLVN